MSTGIYSFTQSHRLKKADEFSSVFIFRKVKHGKYLKIHYKPNELSNSRLGIIVSKKNHKRANKRNYMKRTIRELFRHNQAIWNNYDLIVRVNKFFTPSEFEEVKQEFNYLTKVLQSKANKLIPI
ncbi:MAG: ribonuclease P protein component [Burkholderiales bacterium]